MFKHSFWPRVFRTDFNIAKSQRPFTDLPQQIDLQVLNGICMDRILLSDKTYAEFAIHRPIASEIKSICREITSLKNKISILIDEYTTLGKKTTLMAAIRTFFTNFPGDAYSTCMFSI